MSTVITVENLGKKYTISHQQREDHSSLRDLFSNRLSYYGKKLIHPFRHSSPGSLPLESAIEDFWALKDVFFDVKQGERIGIIGRNGAGKSTLLKILSRITEPTLGSVRIKGKVASLLEVGTGFHPELTGRENIFLNGAILGMGRQEISKKFDEIVAFSEIEKFLDTPVKRYSSGMYVRLAFAVAAHLEPEILIVDEVLAVGDAGFQKKCLGKMEEVGKEGRTVLFVSHNLGMVRQLCDRGFLLEAGNILCNDTVSNAINQYLSSGVDVSELEVSLADHPNRLTGMNKSLKKLSIKNMNCEVASSFSQFDSISIEFEYETNNSVNLAGAGFIICTQEGVRVGGGNTYMSYMPPHKIPSKGRVVFTFSARQLTPGYYNVTVSLGSHQGVLVDKVENAIGFSIYQADIYGTGYLLTKDDGVIALSFETHVEDRSNILELA